MLESYLKPTYQKYFIHPLLQSTVIHRTSPNTITLFSLLSGVSIFLALYCQQTIMAFMLLIISGYLDTLDGAVARAMQRTSSVGTVFDIMSDRIVECSIVFGLFSIDPAHRGALALCMLASMLICITSFLVVGIFAQNTSEKSFYYSPGLMERAEAFIFFALMICLPEYFAIIAVAFSVLVLFTGLMRMKVFVHNQE